MEDLNTINLPAHRAECEVLKECVVHTIIHFSKLLLSSLMGASFSWKIMETGDAEVEMKNSFSLMPFPLISHG